MASRCDHIGQVDGDDPRLVSGSLGGCRFIDRIGAVAVCIERQGFVVDADVAFRERLDADRDRRMGRRHRRYVRANAIRDGDHQLEHLVAAHSRSVDVQRQWVFANAKR